MQQSLIEEAVQRAAERTAGNLTLVRLSFETGLARATRLAQQTGRVIDPVATCCFDEALELLLRTEPDVGLALVALAMAAQREPGCYGQTFAAVHELLSQGLQDAVDDEFERGLDELGPDGDSRERSKVQ